MRDGPCYRSGVALVWPLLACACMFTLVMAVVLRVQSHDASTVLHTLAVSVALVFVCAAVPCRYVLGPDTLRVQSGLIILRLRYTDIHAVSLEQSWTLAPALSPHRIVLHCAQGKVRISPVRPIEFLVELKERLPPTDDREPTKSGTGRVATAACLIDLEG